MSKGKVLDELYAFIAIDDDGDEGIVTCLDLSKQSYAPMIGADMERVNSLRPIAQDITTRTGKRIVLRRFHLTQDVEYLTP